MGQRFIIGVGNLSSRFPQEQKAISIVLNGNASELNGILVDKVGNFIDILEDLVTKDIAYCLKMPELDIHINRNLRLAH